MIVFKKIKWLPWKHKYLKIHKDDDWACIRFGILTIKLSRINRKLLSCLKYSATGENFVKSICQNLFIFIRSVTMVTKQFEWHLTFFNILEGHASRNNMCKNERFSLDNDKVIQENMFSYDIIFNSNGCHGNANISKCSRMPTGHASDLKSATSIYPESIKKIAAIHHVTVLPRFYWTTWKYREIKISINHKFTVD